MVVQLMQVLYWIDWVLLVAYIYGYFREGLLVYTGSFLLIYLFKFSRKKFSSSTFSSSVADYVVYLWTELGIASSWCLAAAWRTSVVHMVRGLNTAVGCWCLFRMKSSKKQKCISIIPQRLLSPNWNHRRIAGVQLFYWMTQPCFPTGSLKTAF